MYYQIRAAISVALTILLANFVDLPVPAQTARRAEPRTVIDYFLLVPDRYIIDYDRKLREDMVRNGFLNIVDVKNGYIYYNASDNPEEFEFAIFRKPDGRHLVAFSSGYDPSCCSHPIMSTLLFLSYENGRWRDVTRATLPVAFNKRLTYKLPREGRDIVVVNAKGSKAYTMAWVNGKFVVRR
jgi:hypothetical protein